VLTACTTIARTAVTTPLIRRAPRAEALPGPATTTTTTVVAASAPETIGPAWANQVMNNASCSAPACQVRPVLAHQRRNNAIECA
jgi:hypothetical protein